MTYLQFHLVFLLPPILALALTARRDARPLAGRLASRTAPALWALGTILLLALLYTTPWDNYLVYREVWGYPPGRVLATILYVPIEEYAFFLLQPVLTSLFLFQLLRRGARPRGVSAAAGRTARRFGTALFAAATVVGVAAIAAGGSWTYLGLILAWAAPVAALQWAVGGHRLLAWRGPVALAVAVPTLYLWIADRIAIGLGIWWISSDLTTGLAPFGLPVEEALFFLLTNVMVVQGVLLFLDMGPALLRRWRARRAAA